MTSIRRRILLPLIPLTALALAATAWGIHSAVRRDLLRALDRTVVVLAQGVGSAVELQLDGELEFELEGSLVLAFEEPLRGAFYVIREETGQVLETSLAPAPPSLPKPAPSPNFVTRRVYGTEHRIGTLPLQLEAEDDLDDRREWQEEHPGEPIPEAAARTLWVTVGHATGEVQSTLAVLRTYLVLGLGTLFVALALLPAWIVSRSLRPLKRLSAAADRVGPDAPHTRLPEGGADREVHTLVAALNRALGRVTSAYQRQKRFTADAAHELRTPISALRTHCEVALRKVHTAEELRAALHNAHHAALRMGGIVESLLALSRLQHAEDFAARESVDLADVVREAANLNRPAADSKGVHLNLATPRSILAAGDADLLVESVSNLIDNAIRYTPQGGSVVVSADDGTAPRIVVQDTGVGVPEEHRDRIFDRFHRVDKARARAEGGAGLGLSIAREIARLHRGEIRLHSRPGEGSRFEVRLGGRNPGTKKKAAAPSR